MNTEIELPVAPLKSVLTGFSRIVSTSNPLPVFQCVKVTSIPQERTIWLQASNVNEMATVRLEGKGEGPPGQLLVPLELLRKITKGCSSHHSIQLLASSRGTRIRFPVAGGFVDRMLAHSAAEDWPASKVIDQEPTMLAAEAKWAFLQALQCTSSDASRYILNGVCLDNREKEAHYLVGTDGKHLFAANTFTFNLPEHLIIPSNKFLTWPGFTADGPWRLRMIPGNKADDKQNDPNQTTEPPWFQIDSDHWSYQARAIDGQFPNWKQVVPVQTSDWTRIELSPASASAMMDVLNVLPGNQNPGQPVTMLVTGGLKLMAPDNDQPDWTTIQVPEVAVSGNAVHISLNRGYLQRALHFGLHHLRILDSLSPLIFTAPGKTMIVMPIRIQGPWDAAVIPGAPGGPAISQNENTPTAQPSAGGAQTTTEETTSTMPTAVVSPPEPDNPIANLNKTNGENDDGRCSFRAALDHIGRIKANLRQVITDLNQALTLLKTAQKEQRTTAKEIEAVRATLRDIQSVEI